MSAAAPRKYEFLHSVVSASALHRLAPLLARRRDCMLRAGGGRYLWGWRVEPCAAGGVLVIATNGIVMGVIHDPQGTATQSVTILASKGLRRAVKPPKARPVYYPGDIDEVELPDQFQPEKVTAHSLFASVWDRAHITDESPPGENDDDRSLYTERAEDGPIWGGGYRLVEEYLPWRRVVENWKPEDLTPANFRLGTRAFAAFRHFDQDTLDLSAPSDNNLPVLVRAREHPDFIGFAMRGSMEIAPPSPAELPDSLAPGPAPAEAEA